MRDFSRANSEGSSKFKSGSILIRLMNVACGELFFFFTFLVNVDRDMHTSCCEGDLLVPCNEGTMYGIATPKLFLQFGGL